MKIIKWLLIGYLAIPFIDAAGALMTAPAELVEKCGFVASHIATISNSLPDATINDERSAIKWACIVANMPADWPGRDDAKRIALQHYDTAKRIDPEFAPLDFSWKYDIDLPGLPRR